jgi:hypothetical protein
METLVGSHLPRQVLLERSYGRRIAGSAFEIGDQPKRRTGADGFFEAE